MKIINSSYEILIDINSTDIYKHIEKISRTCYKSKAKINKNSSEKLIEQLIKNGHEAMIEFYDITIKFICSRGVSHELVRHRLCNFAQESTRYCNYSHDKFGNELTFINPVWRKNITEDPKDFAKEVLWVMFLQKCEKTYFDLLDAGLTAQEARGVLPNDLSTEINVKANIREWRHILKLRTALAAHPDMRDLMMPLLKELQEKLPLLFGDIQC